MRLNDPLVTSFSYENKEYDIDLSFDTVLDVYDVLDNDKIRDHEKARLCLILVIGEHDKRGIEAIELWNYIYLNFIHVESKKVVKKDLLGNPIPVPKEEKENKRLIDFTKDANYIYSSFMQAYNINLIDEQGKLHWKEFLALLDGLPSNTKMREVMRIRDWKPSKHDSKEYKEQMRELQEFYSLESEVD